MKDISANSIDLIICDLPYGCLADQRTPNAEKEKATKSLYKKNSGGCDWDIKINLEKFWEQARRILRNEHSPVLHFCTTKFGYELIKSNESWFRYDLVWDKQRGVSFLSANKMPMRSHEMIYVFSKAGAYYNRVDITGDFGPSQGGGKGSKVYNCKPYVRTRKETASTQYNTVRSPETINTGTRCVLSVIPVTTKAVSGAHPTQKPVELYKWLIQRYCPPGGTVLDPTFGSGNSVFTAYEMGMNAIGIEKDAGFYDKAADKLNTIE